VVTIEVTLGAIWCGWVCCCCVAIVPVRLRHWQRARVLAGFLCGL